MSQPILFKSEKVVPLLKREMPMVQIVSPLNVSADWVKACQSLYCKEFVNAAKSQAKV